MACESAKNNLEENRLHLSSMRDRLEDGLTRLFPDLEITGNLLNRLPNTLNVRFRKTREDFQKNLFARVAASSGSACHAGVNTVSPVLEAMGIPAELARGAVRFSTGKFTTEKEIDETLDIIRQIASSH